MKSVKEFKFKDLILHNFALKILAVVLAVVIWVAIVNIDNPSRTTMISGIQVVFLNEDALGQKGYTYSVQSGSVISISVKAPQSIAESLEASDFYAYADFSELSPTSDKAKIYVRCEKSEVVNQIDIVSLRTEYVSLSIDNKLSKEITIESSYTGEPADGYVVGECYVAPDTVTVTGAESIVNRIKTAKVVYDVSNLKQSISEDAKIVFYDENGAEVKSDLLTLNRNTGRINIEIIPTKWIEVNYAVNGEPAAGYVVSESKGSLERIQIAATKDILDGITSIDIPSDVLSTEGISENTTLTVPLGVYLPSGCRIVSSESTLTVDITVLRKAEIDYLYSDISLTDTNSDYDYKIISNSDNFKITITGEKDVVDTIKPGNLDITASMADRKPGKYTVRLNIKKNTDYNIEGTYDITVEVTEKSEQPTTPVDDTTESTPDSSNENNN